MTDDDRPKSPRLAYDPQTVQARFRIGDHFPPDDYVGQFVIGLAAACDDLMLLNSILFPVEDPDRDDFTKSERSALMRRLLGTIWELHEFVKSAAAFPVVLAFLQEIEAAYPEGQTFTGSDLVDLLVGNTGATQPQLRNIMKVARHATFHYTQVGRPEFHEVLERMRDIESSFEGGEKMPSLRMVFAEDIMLNLALRELERKDAPTFEEVVRTLAPTVIAVVHLAQVAVDLWLGLHGGVRLEPIDQTPN